MRVLISRPKMVGRGIPGSPMGPPVKETQLFMILNVITWNAKVAMAK